MFEGPDYTEILAHSTQTFDSILPCCLHIKIPINALKKKKDTIKN